MNDTECRQVLTVLTAAYPKAEMPRQTAALYRRCLQDLPVEVARAATLQAVTTCKWLPTIAELRDIVAGLYQVTDGRPSVEDAWREFQAAVHRYGHTGTPEWSHPAVANAAQIIGFRDYCMSDVEDQAIWRAQFRKVYESQASRERESLRMLPDVHRAIAALAEAKAAPYLADAILPPTVSERRE